MSDWLSFEQILGYVASIILLIGYGIKSDIKTKSVLTMSSLLFASHFFLLGAFTASAICLINSARNISSVFYYKSKILCFVFSSLYLISGYFTYNSFIDILPLAASFLTCIGMFLLGGLKFRILIVFATIPWIIHNIYVGSIGGTINSAVLFFITLITVFRLYYDEAHSVKEVTK